MFIHQILRLALRTSLSGGKKMQNKANFKTEDGKLKAEDSRKNEKQTQFQNRQNGVSSFMTSK